MTGLNDQPIHIKLEPISPANAYDLEEGPFDTHGQGQDHSTSTPLATSLTFGGATWHRPMVNEAAVANERMEAMATTTSTSQGTRKALQKKIQSDRLARGQEELTVKFETRTSHELTVGEVKKKERRKQQNREAARRCRVKKREIQSVAHAQFRNMVEDNENLFKLTETLKYEIENIKKILEDHENSGHCKLVHRSSEWPESSTISPNPAIAGALDVGFSQPQRRPHLQPKPRQIAHSETEQRNEQDSINQIAKELEMSCHDPQSDTTPASKPCNGDITLDMLQHIFETDQSMDSFLDLSKECQGDLSLLMETNADETVGNSEDFVKDADLNPNDIFHFGNGVSKPNVVRSLNQEFARCTGQDPSSSLGFDHISQFATQQKSFSTYPPQQQSTASSRPLPSNLNLQALYPISPVSSCTSPRFETSPASVTSPYFFQQHAELLGLSPPDGNRCQEAPSPYVFQFQHDARSSPSC